MCRSWTVKNIFTLCLFAAHLLVCHYSLAAPSGKIRVYFPLSLLRSEDWLLLQFPTYRHFVFQLSPDPKGTYQLLVIENDDYLENENRADQPEGKYVLSLAQRAKDATWEEFRRVMKKDYPGEYSEERIQKMYDEDRLFGTHMARLVVLKGKDFKTAEILATLKLTVEGDNGKGLDVEQTIEGLNFPRDWHFEIPTAEYPPGSRRFEASRPELRGGVMQLSGFMNRGPKELGAIIHFAASHLALQGPSGYINVVLNEDLKANLRAVTRDRIQPSLYESLHITETAVYCAQHQADYYKRFLGFHEIPGWNSESSGEHVLNQSMADFKKAAARNIFWRKGRQLIERFGFWRVYDDDPAHPEALHWAINEHGFIGSWPSSPVSQNLGLRERILDDLVNDSSATRLCRQAHAFGGR
jgi:hypothetical protein